jgi:hypothetical protein
VRGTRVSLFSARGCPPRAKSTEFTPCHGTVPVEFTEARAASVLRGPSADRSLRTVRKLLSRKAVAGGWRTHAVLFLVGCQGVLHARAISLSLSTRASSGWQPRSFVLWQLGEYEDQCRVSMGEGPLPLSH